MRILLRSLLPLLACLAFVACHDHSDGGGSGSSAVAQGMLTNTGGSVEVVDPQSPIAGAKVVAPADAVDAGDTIHVTIGFEDAPPGPLAPDTEQVSKVVELQKDAAHDFRLPLSVTLPYDGALVGPDDVLVALYWDPTYGMYFPVGVKSIDDVAHTLTFTTTHFSKFVIVIAKGLAAAIPSADSGFRSDVDGFFHPNFGAYDSPGGCCLGMANYSTWYYVAKKATDGNALYTKYKQADVLKWQDDVTARELISRSFIGSSQIWAHVWLLAEYLQTDAQTGLQLIALLKITGQPQTLLIKGAAFGHAAVVQRYDAALGRFFIYDNNYPGEEVTLDWSLAGGFQNYSKAANYPPITQFGYEPMSSVLASSQFETYYEGAESGWSGSKFVSVGLLEPLLNPDGRAQWDGLSGVIVRGTATGGILPAKFVVPFVNGLPYVNAAQLSAANVNAQGEFMFVIPEALLPNANNTVTLIATNDHKNAWNAYAGYFEFSIKKQGVNFFANLGFETGDLASWSHETHTWNNPSPGSFTPEKSEIVGSLTDPIATTIQVPEFGAYACRVNNEDNNYHISSITQSAVVPNVPNPQLSFKWAAVLEDPSHSPSDQPYCDISVLDETTSTYLYQKHFFTNDPAFSGWQPFLGGSWKAIPWQTVQVDITGTQGHTLTIKVIGADCALGGHGGYVYFDGEE